MFDCTIIWRPGQESEFRGDHVTVQNTAVETVHQAALQIYINELVERGAVLEEIQDATSEMWDLCAILEGHCKFIY